MPVFNNRTPQYAEQVEGGIGRMKRDRLLEGDQLWWNLQLCCADLA